MSERTVTDEQNVMLKKASRLLPDGFVIVRRVTKVNYLTVSENAALKLACEPINRAFGGGYGIYHVGSSITRHDYRDVDVRLILDDAEFERLFGTGKKSPSTLDLWFLMCWAISEWMKHRTGLPVDFQIQSMAMANTPENDGPRNGLFFANSSDEPESRP